MKTNRLINERSTYLIAHAENPVDWYPWSDEAFETASRLDRPVFLSIGYSSCHWCHVMEKESFNDQEIAALLNRVFICVKVDREERPDIDKLYIEVCQVLTGHGGWPLTILMTAQKKPFFAGTYIPKENSYGRVGMLQLIPKVEELWKNKRDEIYSSVEKIFSVISNVNDPDQAKAEKNQSGNYPLQTDRSVDLKINEKIFDAAYLNLEEIFDGTHGGFGTKPKFPTPQNLLFLLRYHKRTGKIKALEMVEKTVREMRLGGIWDQVGGGFHRYSTDERWHVPHFEKMLYDQAMMIVVCSELFQATHKPFYTDIINSVRNYMTRDLLSVEGGFFTSQDADSEGEEGKFYLWEEKELKKILSPDESEAFSKTFNIKQEGNYIDEATGLRNGKNLPFLTAPIEKIYAEYGMGQKGNFKKNLQKAIGKLYRKRLYHRTHPVTDEKILLDLNSMAVIALVRSAIVLRSKYDVITAKEVMKFILSSFLSDDFLSKDRLYRSFFRGGAGKDANIDDYSYLIWALLELYEITFDPDYLEKALSFNKYTIEHFMDQSNGGFYFTSDESEKLIVRVKSAADGPYPSGSSVAMANLAKLGNITGNPDLIRQSEKAINAFADQIYKSPLAFLGFINAYSFATGSLDEIVICSNQDNKTKDRMLKEIRKRYLPNKIIIFKPQDRPEVIKKLKLLAPFTEGLKAKNGRVTVYVCKNNYCDQPITGLKQLYSYLDE